MNLKTLGWSALAVTFFAAPLALAADHQDGPAATADPSADITDVFAWTSSDATKVNLVMDVFPFATSTAQFSNTVQYVFHTSSQPAYGGTVGGTVNVICTFDTAQTISCWAGSEYVTGNANTATGLSSADGKMTVFAGLRADPFFFNLDGFKAVAADVTAAKGSLTFDTNGCPALGSLTDPTSTASVLVNQLMSAPDGGAPVDHFVNATLLAIVVQLDKTILTAGGPVVSVWAATHVTP
ncbi:MAG: DUF4331 family protein [Myxococcaceae bacterium]